MLQIDVAEENSLPVNHKTSPTVINGDTINLEEMEDWIEEFDKNERNITARPEVIEAMN